MKSFIPVNTCFFNNLDGIDWFNCNLKEFKVVVKADHNNDNILYETCIEMIWSFNL